MGNARGALGLRTRPPADRSRGAARWPVRASRRRARAATLAPRHGAHLQETGRRGAPVPNPRGTRHPGASHPPPRGTPAFSGTPKRPPPRSPPTGGFGPGRRRGSSGSPAGANGRPDRPPSSAPTGRRARLRERRAPPPPPAAAPSNASAARRAAPAGHPIREARGTGDGGERTSSGRSCGRPPRGGRRGKPGGEPEGRPVAGVVGVEEFAREGGELAAVPGQPAIVDGAELGEPGAGLRVLERSRIREIRIRVSRYGPLPRFRRPGRRAGAGRAGPRPPRGRRPTRSPGGPRPRGRRGGSHRGSPSSGPGSAS